jgi:hypothetical protein
MSPPNYFKQVNRSSCFGQSRHFVTKALNAMQQPKLISYRDIILVVHGGDQGLKLLQASKIEITPLYVWDVQKAAQHPLDLDHRIQK